MSRENMEVVQGVYDAAGRRESAAVLALYDPKVELDGTRLGVVGTAGWVFTATKAFGPSSASGTKPGRASTISSKT